MNIEECRAAPAGMAAAATADLRSVHTPPRARSRSLAVLATVAVLLAGTAGPAAAADTASAAVTVDSGRPAGRLPADFVGLSFEMRELGIGNLDPARGNLADLLRTLGPSNLRIGGNTLDRDTMWIPAGQQPPDPLPDWVKDVVRPGDIGRLDRFLAATGWRAEVGVNVGRWDPAAVADQARTMRAVLGDRLVAVECGNEPDQWVGKGFRPAGYGYAEYLQDWKACAAAVGARLAGPDTAAPTSAWATGLAQQGPADGLRMLTVHQYAMDPTGTADRLLSPATVAAQRDSTLPNLTAATAAHLPLRIDETNSAWGGGIDGVSNTHASALWALDYSLELAQLGVAGLNFHGGLGVCNQPIWNGKWQLYTPVCAADTADEAAQIYRAMPIYYGLWLARRMGPGRFVPLTLDTAANVRAYAVRGDDGRLRVAVIDKDRTAVSLDLTVPGCDLSGGAEVLRLAASGLDATDTTVQGATVDRSGRLRPGRPERVPVRHGTLHVELAAGSAVLVTL